MIKHVLISGFLLVATYYLLSPVPGMPPPPAGGPGSSSPADTESIYRTSYYTHLTRADITGFYQSLWRQPLVNLIIPPEDAPVVIRDQARSSWIEELIHPLKDSLYINGFYPVKPTEQINLAGQHWEGKITIHYIPSHPVTRLTVLLLVAVSGYLLIKDYAQV